MTVPQNAFDFRRLLKQWIVIAFGVAIASWLNDGIQYNSIESLLLAVLLISGLNVFLKPVLVLFGLPFILMTLGIGILLINALIFSLAGAVVPGFEVVGFWSAFWGAIVVSLITLLVNVVLARPRVVVARSQPSGPKTKGGAKKYQGRLDDVIDI